MVSRQAEAACEIVPGADRQDPEGHGVRAGEDAVDEARRVGSAVLLGHLHPVLHVAGDDEVGDVGVQVEVAVLAARLVLDEVVGLVHLADVVVVGADAGEQPVGADRVARRLGEVRDGGGDVLFEVGFAEVAAAISEAPEGLHDGVVDGLLGGRIAEESGAVRLVSCGGSGCTRGVRSFASKVWLIPSVTRFCA